MKIKKLHIKNFKSLVDLEIVDPNPFTVFVGANGVGKSNIFEALEFHLLDMTGDLKLRLFGGYDEVANFRIGRGYSFCISTDKITFDRQGSYISDEERESSPGRINHFELNNDFEENERQKFRGLFSRIFIAKEEYQKINYPDAGKLNLSSSNLEKVLKRLLADDNKRGEILDWLQLFIPGFEKIEIHSDNIGGTDTLLIYEKGSKKPFHRRLISDGTYNILCLLTAVFQSDEPQFLCIEEPENGLNPFVAKELVTLFRSICDEKGHYIWLNTHSQSLVETLVPDEIILVDKVNGETKTKQIKGMNLHGIPADEAWFSGALGGGTPW